MSDEPSVKEEGGSRSAAVRTALLAVAVGSLAVGAWAASRPGEVPAAPIRTAPVAAAPVATPDPATSVLQVRPIADTPYTALFSGIGPEDAEDGPSLFTAPRVVGVHNVVLLDTDTGASRRLLPTDERLVFNARLLTPPGKDAAPEWIALDVATAEGQPVDLTIARLDGSAAPLTLPKLVRVVRVWSRTDGTLGALVNDGTGLAYRLIDGATLAVTASCTVPLSGGPPPAP